MGMFRSAVPGLLVLAIGLFAVAGHAADASALAGSEWRPTQLGEVTVPDDTVMFVRFQGDGRATGHGGCNRFFGPYVEDDDGLAITIGPLGATRMMCPAAMMAGETALLEALQTATHFRRDRVVLQLFDADDQEIARFAQTDWD